MVFKGTTMVSVLIGRLLTLIWLRIADCVIFINIIDEALKDALANQVEKTVEIRSLWHPHLRFDQVPSRFSFIDELFGVSISKLIL